MYCDRCGTQVASGGQFCTNCGKALAPGAPAPRANAATRPGAPTQAGSAAYPLPPAARVDETRVRRHIHLLAWLWLINGILRLAAVSSVMIFGTIFFPFMRGWKGPEVWPLGGRWGMDFPFSAGLFSVGLFLAMFGVLHLVLAWGLFEREPWARVLGIAIGCLALLRFPLGTALGVYTLWVLLPESSSREYDRLSQPGTQMNGARAPS
jgi:hypothetical protein